MIWGAIMKKQIPLDIYLKRRMGGTTAQYLPPMDCYKNKLSKLIWYNLSKRYYS